MDDPYETTKIFEGMSCQGSTFPLLKMFLVFVAPWARFCFLHGNCGGHPPTKSQCHVSLVGGLRRDHGHGFV